MDLDLKMRLSFPFAITTSIAFRIPTEIILGVVYACSCFDRPQNPFASSYGEQTSFPYNSFQILIAC